MSTAAGSEPPAPRGTVVTVTAAVTSKLEPELGTVRLAVAFDGHQRSAVLERCTHVAAKVHASLEAMNAPDRSPLTRWSQSQTSVWSDRPWNAEGKQLPLVYHAQVEFTATFADFGELGAWVAATSSREGLTISGIDWSLRDTSRERAEADARMAAVVDAKSKAEQYASALGLRIVAAIEIADRGLLTAGSLSPVLAEYSAKRMSMSDAGAPPPMRPEPVVVEAAVDARFLAN